MQSATLVRLRNAPHFLFTETVDAVKDRCAITYDSAFVYLVFQVKHKDRGRILVPLFNVDYLQTDLVEDKPAPVKK